MLAFKCDVCGKLFEEDMDKINHVEFSYMRATDQVLAWNEEEYDVCPKCMDSISSLIQLLKPENHIINKERSE